MQLRIYSDLHQEFKEKKRFEIAVLPNEKEQILVLAGDIIKLKSIVNYLDFFKNLNDRFKAVLYVFGNHEYYNFKIGKEYFKRIEKELSGFKKIHLLSRYTKPFKINGYKFVGATLWTNNDGIYMKKEMSNDFKKITYHYKGQYSTFSPVFWRNEFHHDFKYLVENIKKNEKTIVITHHAPSIKNEDPDDLTGEYKVFYRNELDYYIKEYDNIKLWIHGHIHNKDDFIVGETRVFSNPIGYYDIIDESPEYSLIELES